MALTSSPTLTRIRGLSEIDDDVYFVVDGDASSDEMAGNAHTFWWYADDHAGAGTLLMDLERVNGQTLLTVAGSVSLTGSLTTGITDTYVLYSNAGVLSGDAGLTYAAATDALTVAGRLNVGASTYATATGQIGCNALRVGSPGLGDQGDIYATDGTNVLSFDASLGSFKFTDAGGTPFEFNGASSQWIFENGLDVMWQDSGGTKRQIFTLHTDNVLYIDGATTNDIVLRTNFTERLRIDHSDPSVKIANALSVGTPGWTLAANDLAVGSGTSSRVVWDNSALTWLQYGTGAAVFNQFSSVAGTATVFNEQGQDIDFRIESDNNSSMFVVDAGEDTVRMIATSSSPAYGWGSGGGNTYQALFLGQPVGNNGVVIGTGTTVEAPTMSFGSGYDGLYGRYFEVRSDITSVSALPGASGTGFANIHQAMIARVVTTDGTASNYKAVVQTQRLAPLIGTSTLELSHTYQATVSTRWDVTSSTLESYDVSGNNYMHLYIAGYANFGSTTVANAIGEFGTGTLTDYIHLDGAAGNITIYGDTNPIFYFDPGADTAISPNIDIGPSVTTANAGIRFYRNTSTSGTLHVYFYNSTTLHHWFGMNAGQAVIWNESGVDIDFRVEAVGHTSALFVQGSDGAVSMSAWANVGTTTSANAVGDFSTGLTGAARIWYDQSGESTNWYSSASVLEAYLLSGATPTFYLGSDTSTGPVQFVLANDGTSGGGPAITFRRGGANNWQIYQSAGTNLYFRDMVNSRMTFTIKAAEVVVNDDGADIDFRVELSGGTNAISVDAALGTVTLKNAVDIGTPGWTLAANDFAVGSSSTNRLVWDNSAGQSITTSALGAQARWEYNASTWTEWETNSAGNVSWNASNAGAFTVTINKTAAGTGMIFGNAKMGVWSTSGAYAVFAHSSVEATTGSYAIIQDSTGESFFNSASGKVLNFRIGNSEVGRFQTGGFSVGAPGWTLAANDFAVGSGSGQRAVWDNSASLFRLYGGALTVDTYTNSGGTTLAVATGDAAFGSSTTYWFLDESTDTILFETDSAGATGLIWRTYHNSASPAAADVIYTARHDGEDDGGSTITYCEYRAVIDNPAAASVTSHWEFDTWDAGIPKVASLSAAGVWTDASSARGKSYLPDWQWERGSALATVRALDTGVYHSVGDPDGPLYVSPSAECFRDVTGLAGTRHGIAPKDLAGLALLSVVEVDDRVDRLEAEVGRLREILRANGIVA